MVHDRMKRARPARRSPAAKSGDAAITIRLSRALLERLDRWIADQAGPLGRPEAICRLTESALGPGGTSQAGESDRGSEIAAGMASDMIDYLADPSATREDRDQRKSRLLKGPSEFRGMRKKHGDARRKK